MVIKGGDFHRIRAMDFVDMGEIEDRRWKFKVIHQNAVIKGATATPEREHGTEIY